LLKYLHQHTGNGQQNAKADDGTIKAEASTIDATKLEQKNNSYSTGIVNVVTPFFFLRWIVREALKESLFFELENYLNQNVDLKNICIFNTFDIMFTTFLKKAGIIYEYETSGGDVDVMENIFSTGSQILKFIRSTPNTFKPVNNLPKMTLGELLVSTQNLLNIIFDFRPDKKYRILSRDEILKLAPIDLDKYAIDSWEITDEKKDMALKFKRDTEENDLIFSEKFTDLSDRRADIKYPVNSWEEMEDILFVKTEGDIRQIKSSQIYAEYKWFTPEKVADDTKTVETTDILGWQQISIGFQNGWFNFGKAKKEEIETKFGVVYGFGSVLSVLQQGNMNVWKSKRQSFAPRLMIYRGNNTGGPETDTLSLDYEKEEIGILPKLWKLTSQFISGRLPVERKFDFSVNILKYIIYNKCRKYSTAEGAFIPDEIRCTLFIDHISETTIKGFKV
jgi:hypothetical protein